MDAGRIRWIRLQDRMRNVMVVRAFEWTPKQQHNAERKHVRSTVQVAGAAKNLFGSGVVDGAGKLAALGQGRPSDLARETEVRQHCAAIAPDQDVGWLDVAVQNSGTMCMSQGVRNLPDDASNGLEVVAAPGCLRADRLFRGRGRLRVIGSLPMTMVVSL